MLLWVFFFYFLIKDSFGFVTSLLITIESLWENNILPKSIHYMSRSKHKDFAVLKSFMQKRRVWWTDLSCQVHSVSCHCWCFFFSKHVVKTLLILENIPFSKISILFTTCANWTARAESHHCECSQWGESAEDWNHTHLPAAEDEIFSSFFHFLCSLPHFSVDPFQLLNTNLIYSSP